jgi:peptidoglycan/xylan/chitin deacetylase (PgdA/CDA1 family)
MRFYWVKTNTFIKKIFSSYFWDIPNNRNEVYLTFDDGPIPVITDWVLSELEKHNASATFFCIGKNIQENPEVFKRIIKNGHAIGNHTHNHLDGWTTKTKHYLKNIELCSQTMANEDFHFGENQKTPLFRPPYGKIKRSQTLELKKLGYKIIMWDILSADFDTEITKEECLNNVLKNASSGSIIVFHDSKKAFEKLHYVLPKVLDFLDENKFICKALD